MVNHFGDETKNILMWKVYMGGVLCADIFFCNYGIESENKKLVALTHRVDKIATNANHVSPSIAEAGL